MRKLLRRLFALQNEAKAPVYHQEFPKVRWNSLDAIGHVDEDIIHVSVPLRYSPEQAVEVYEGVHPFSCRGVIRIKAVGLASLLTYGLPLGTKKGDWLIAYGTGS